MGKHRVPSHLLPLALDAQFGIPYPRSTGFDIDRECTKVTVNWLAKVYEDTIRSNPGAGVETIMSYTKKTFGVHVPKSLAYRARRQAVEVVQGDHRLQYHRLRDYLQCVLDTNPGSRCIVTTKEDLENPAPTPRFHYMFYCLFACKEGFLNGCRPFIGT